MPRKSIRKNGPLIPNKYIECDDHYKLIITSNKKGEYIVLIDKESLELVSGSCWSIHLNKNGRPYAKRNRVKKGEQIRMHRLIYGAINSKDEIDHIDDNSLNNMRSNLRLVTHAQNNMNKKPQSNNTSGFKGVYRYTGRIKNFWSYIWVNGKRISGGYFDNPIDAAKKYNELAIKYHGEFAYLNTIPNE